MHRPQVDRVLHGPLLLRHDRVTRRAPHAPCHTPRAQCTAAARDPRHAAEPPHPPPPSRLPAMHAVCRYVSLRLLLYHHRSIRGSELHDFWPAKWVDRLVGPAIGPFVLGFLPWKAEPMEDVGLWCQQTMLFFHLQARAATPTLSQPPPPSAVLPAAPSLTPLSRPHPAARRTPPPSRFASCSTRGPLRLIPCVRVRVRVPAACACACCAVRVVHSDRQHVLVAVARGRHVPRGPRAAHRGAHDLRLSDHRHRTVRRLLPPPL